MNELPNELLERIWPHLASALPPRASRVDLGEKHTSVDIDGGAFGAEWVEEGLRQLENTWVGWVRWVRVGRWYSRVIKLPIGVYLWRAISRTYHRIVTQMEEGRASAANYCGLNSLSL